MGWVRARGGGVGSWYGVAACAAVALVATAGGAALPALTAGATGVPAAASSQPTASLVTPRHGDVIPERFEVELRTAGVGANLHILARDVSGSAPYRYLAMVAAPLKPDATTVRRVVDMTGLGTTGVFQLVVVSTDTLVVSAAGLVASRDVAVDELIDSIEVRRAATFVAPGVKAPLEFVDVVQATGFLPGTYTAAVVRPEVEGGYWVQNNAASVTPGVPVPLRVHFGGNGTFHVYVGVTFDPTFFREGDRLLNLPKVDGSGRPVYWVGPVAVSKQ